MQTLQEPGTYTNSTTNMMQHVNCHDSEKLKAQPSVRKKLLMGQTTLTGRIAAPLTEMAARAAAVTQGIIFFMAKDLKPFSIVENEGFRLLVNTLESRYRIPSCPYFSKTLFPMLYRETKSKVVDTLRKADSVSITTDSWTSTAPQSYITVTAHANVRVGDGQFCTSKSPSV